MLFSTAKLQTLEVTVKSYRVKKCQSTVWQYVADIKQIVRRKLKASADIIDD